MLSIFKDGETYTLKNYYGERLECTREQAIQKMLECDIEEEEIFIAFNMLAHGHNYANFGVNKTFIYSKKLES